MDIVALLICAVMSCVRAKDGKGDVDFHFYVGVVFVSLLV